MAAGRSTRDKPSGPHPRHEGARHMDDGAIRILYRSNREHRGGAFPIVASDLCDLGTVLIDFDSFFALLKSTFLVFHSMYYFFIFS